MVGMMMRTENVLDRLAGDAFDLRYDAIEILHVLVVDQDYSFAGDIDSDIAAVALNFVEVFLDLLRVNWGGGPP